MKNPTTNNKQSKGMEQEILALRKQVKKLEDKNLLKDQFLSNISHELRTPLNGILGFAELATYDLEQQGDPKVLEYARYINQSANRILLLLNNIIDYYELESNELAINEEAIGLDPIFKSILDEHKAQATQQDVKVTTQIEDHLNIKADIKFFTRILSNLVQNAIKFSTGGHVKIEAINCFSNNRVVIKISDNGVGIDEEHLNRIFLPFNQESTGTTRLYQGAGMSLPLAKKVIQQMSGNITIQSEKGNGTQVTITMPSTMDNRNQNSSQIHLAKNDEKILVVEDDRLNRELLKEYLKDYTGVCLAESSEQALSIIEGEYAQNKVFSVIIMDINLSSELNGIDLSKLIKSKWSIYHSCSFIAQTGYTLSHEKDYLLENGFDTFIAKPIKKSALIDTLQKLNFIKAENKNDQKLSSAG